MNTQPSPGRARVILGRLVITRAAVCTLTHGDIFIALRRHIRGDWGDVDLEDQGSNDAALKSGGRLLSSYRSTGGVRFWIITEADRSATTILLPEDY